MTTYMNYIITQAKWIGVSFTGFVIDSLAVIYSLMDYNTILLIGLFLIGTIILFYGGFKYNAFHFDREEQNHIFIKEGLYH